MKEQAELSLELISESHETEVVGEEEIAGRNTFHLKATQKNDAALFGEQELWIDKENWLVLKMISNSGDMVTMSEYKHVDFNADITDDLFVIDLPEDVEMLDTSGMEAEEVREIAEAVEKIGQSFLYVPETDEYLIEGIEFTDLGEKHKEVNVTYSKDSGPYFDLAIIDSTIGDDDDFDIDIGGKTVDIRGEKGNYFEMDDFRIVSWEEAGLNYSVQLFDSNLMLEDVQVILGTMELVE